MRHRRSTVIGVAAATALALTAPLTTAASAADQAPGQAQATKPKKAKSSTKVTFYAGLDRPDGDAVDKLQKLSNPDSSHYRDTLTRSKVSEKYGADPDALKALRHSAKGAGLKVTLDGSGVFARIKGTAGKFGKWLGKPVMVVDQSDEVTAQLDYEALGYGVDAHTYFSNGRLPSSVRSHVEEWVPLFQRQSIEKLTASAQSEQQPYDAINRGTPTGCLKDLPPTSPGGNLPPLAEDLQMYAPNQLRTAYGIDGLPTGSKIGKSTRLAIISENGDGFSRQSVAAAATCFDRSPVTYRITAAHGLDGVLPDTLGEADLDVQVAQYVLPPQSTVDVVQALPAGNYDFLTYATAFNLQRRPDVITRSYGSCEVLLKKSFKQPGVVDDMSLQESLFVRMGLAGMSFFNSTADYGSSGCVDQGQGPTVKSVTFPSSSPYVTAVGGSMLQLDASNHRSAEYVWNNTRLVIDGAEVSSPTGGNGGSSILFDRPWWQPAAMTGSGVRTTPDLVAHAGLPGWPLIVADQDTATLLQGTSAATPFSASAVAIIDASERVNGRSSLGMVQPLLYVLRKDKPAVFYDITQYNNDVYGVGCCSAKVGYDKASGLGSVDWAKLHNSLVGYSN